ncbi:hypothetical protein BT63DRAFT_421611 [Microthyrium microscopicum]|uniref:Ribosomal RNA-processing protein 8 n=1 Tax=Microthyrium microscopicum TaxID=703497 RepID=A0A6A6UMG2_9PEZI|nr:hypothetical protein BT63DRAFT_421611 [Microthyrium microscopicum]
MFSVSGWSVTAPLKTQADVTKIPNKAEGSKGTKRKRDGPSTVTGDNVVSLWEHHIEGKSPKKKAKKKPRKEKRDAAQQDEAQDEKTAQNGDATEKETPQQNSTKSKSTSVATVEEGTKKQQKKEKAKSKTTTKDQDKSQLPSTIKPKAKPATEPKLTPLQASMRAKLSSARFRHLNEQLYTTPSNTALTLFTESPSLFSEYHAGFRQQVEVWPENPVDGYISDIRTRGKLRRAPNPNSSVKSTPLSFPLPRTKGTCTVADLGCGDARLSSELQSNFTRLNLKVLSFDLHSPSPLVTRADIAALPLPDGAVDVAIYCLALMGTNWLDFIDEACRVLRWHGELWIAEIKSRFSRAKERSVGGIGAVRQDSSNKKNRKNQDETEELLEEEADGSAEAKRETDVSGFVEALRKRGFVLAGDERQAVDMTNKMFVKLRFMKAVKPTRGKNVSAEEEEEPSKAGTQWQKKDKKKKFIDDKGPEIGEDEGKILKPCVYKLR